MIDPAIFENLQTKIDEETVVRDVSFALWRYDLKLILIPIKELHEIVQNLARKGTSIHLSID